jgi:NAD(P)-dependent dehydrogenase (short-subunit alcohol dehydrogenase family)
MTTEREADDMQSPFALTGKVALVTGGGRGIGRAIALAFADAGATVAITARTRSELDQVAEEIRARGAKAFATTSDVLDAGQVSAMVAEVHRELGALDVIVNNAGGGSVIAPFLELKEADWDLHLARNLKTNFLCGQAAGRIMASHGGGNMINISSVAGMGPHPLRVPYAAAKAGVIALTQTLAVELAPHDIRVNAIAPGFIEVARFLTQFPDYATTVQPARRSKVPLGRLGVPEDVGGLAVFLASDASAYLTGQVIRLDGGLVTTVINKNSDNLDEWW